MDVEKSAGAGAGDWGCTLSVYVSYRALLDRRVLCDLLGFDDATYRAVRRLAQKWCAEPSVRGGKARPKSATYVE